MTSTKRSTKSTPVWKSSHELLRDSLTQTVWTLASATGIIFLALILGGCPSSGTPKIAGSNHPVDKPTTTVLVDGIKPHVEAGKAALVGNDGAKDIVESMTPENVIERKPVAVVRIERGAEEFDAIGKLVPEVKASALGDAKREEVAAKKVATLEAADPVRRGLEVTGYACIGLGILAVAASFLIPVGFAGNVRLAGGVLFVAGLTAATVAYYLPEIRFAIAVTLGVTALGAAVAAVLWGLRHKGVAVDIVRSIEAGKAAGQIVFTDEAKSAKSVVKAYQADATAAFVDRVQRKPSSDSAAPNTIPSVPAQPGGAAA